GLLFLGKRGERAHFAGVERRGSPGTGGRLGRGGGGSVAAVPARETGNGTRGGRTIVGGRGHHVSQDETENETGDTEDHRVAIHEKSSVAGGRDERTTGRE